MPINRRATLAGAALCGLALAPLPGVAQSYPSRIVRLVVPQAPGGTTDVLARAVGERLSKRWGQPVVIENVVGAAGNIGTHNVAKASPDGHTLLVTYEGSQAINPHLYSSQTFDPINDFKPVATFARAGFYVIASPQLPAKNFKEFLELARTRSNPLNYATSGVGSVNHIIGEMLKLEAGINLVHVAHRGIAQAITNISGGHIEAGIAAVPSVIGQVQGGEVRALAVTSGQRSSVTPDVPTIAESGLPNVDVNPWWGMLAPAGIDVSIVNKINTDVNEILQDKGMREFMAKIGAEPYATRPDEFLAILKDNVERWGKVVKATGARAE
jgi:tripartite-type tricarboxylate transporter receptor subunit TctC